MHEQVNERSSPLDDDLFAWQFVTDKRLLDHELELFSSKWFDYRHLTPVQATRLYVAAYRGIYQAHYAANIDRKAAQYMPAVDVDTMWKGLETGDDKQRRYFIGCWRGRQCADAIGIPYEVYIDLAMGFRLNYWKRSYLPQPTHLYSEMVVEKTLERWEELQERKLYIGEHSAYLVQNYAGIEHQDAHHEWLMKQAFKRSNPPMFLARFINEDLLPYEKVQSRYDADTMSFIQRYLQ